MHALVVPFKLEYIVGLESIFLKLNIYYKMTGGVFGKMVVIFTPLHRLGYI